MENFFLSIVEMKNDFLVKREILTDLIGIRRN